MVSDNVVKKYDEYSGYVSMVTNSVMFKNNFIWWSCRGETCHHIDKLFISQFWFILYFPVYLFLK